MKGPCLDAAIKIAVNTKNEELQKVLLDFKNSAPAEKKQTDEREASKTDDKEESKSAPEEEKKQQPKLQEFE